MKHRGYQLMCISALLILLSLVSCSKEGGKEETIGKVKINGTNHVVLEAGYIADSDHDMTCIQFLIEDPEGAYNTSGIEIQMPTSLTEDWFELTSDIPNWRVLLRSIHVGKGMDMNLISEGRVLIKRLGNKDKDNKCSYRVSFEIYLTDGTTAVAEVSAKFQNSMLWIGGR